MKRLVILLVLLPLGLVWGQEGCGVKFKTADQSAFDKAVAAYKAKRYVESATALRKLSARYPQAADPYFYLGLIAVRQDNNVTAIRRYFTKLFEVCPDYPAALAYHHRGVILYTDNQFEEAAAMFSRFFEIANQQQDPDNDAVYEEASNYLYWSQFLAEAELNRSPFNPVVVTGVSSHEDEMLPYFSWDGRWAYYLRRVALHKGKTFYAKELDDKVWRLCVSHWRDTNFSTGEPLPAPFNMNESEGGVTMTSDNRLLYYSVAKPSAGGYNNCDIYYSEFRGGSWSDIKNAGLQVNGEKSWESQPSITPDGQFLYFASNRAGGMGGTDIWRCRRLANGDWSRAENLGSSVNTTGNEKCPFIHADGHTLYFASDGWQGFGGYDMYFEDLADAAVQRPTNLGLPINTESDDICFGVTADGTKGYFAGKSVEFPSVGGRDVYSFELFPAARPEPMRVVRLEVEGDKAQRVTLKVRRRDGSDAEYLSGVDEKELAVALSMKEDNVLSATAHSALPWVKVLGYADVKKGRADGTKIRLVPLAEKAVMQLPEQVFDSKRTRISSMGQRILDHYVEFLQQHPRVHVVIRGGSDVQVKAVQDYFISQKLRAERLRCQSGEQVEGVQLQITQL